MKKHLSVFAFFARSSIYKVLLVIILMSALQIGSFCFCMNVAAGSYSSSSDSFVQLEYLVDDSGAKLVFIGAIILVTFCLFVPVSGYGSRTEYTLKRLSVSERATFFCQAVYNALAYAVLLASQAAVAYLMCRLYVTRVPAFAVGNQTVFLAFYRSEFLHFVLPLADIGLWIRNLFSVVGFGFMTAYFSFRQRRGKFAAATPCLLVYFCIFGSSGEIGNTFNNVVSSLLCVAVVAISVCSVMKREESYEK